jgi:hypothetical protein
MYSNKRKNTGDVLSVVVAHLSTIKRALQWEERRVGK